MVLVKSKNDNIKSGILQCIAEMIVAQIFNHRKQNYISCVYGAIMTGRNWKFLCLIDHQVAIAAREHFIEELERLLGVLLEMLQTAQPQGIKSKYK